MADITITEQMLADAIAAGEKQFPGLEASIVAFDPVTGEVEDWMLNAETALTYAQHHVVVAVRGEGSRSREQIAAACAHERALYLDCFGASA